MICKLCGTTGRWYKVFQYNTPDAYEEWVNIKTPMCRSWNRCLECGLYQSRRTYDVNLLQKIYTDGYRDENFRNESIEDTFKRIAQLPPEESENATRMRFITKRVPRGNLLDIGSGFGIFPYTMKMAGYNVTCIEPNKDSKHFIQTKLNMDCFGGFFIDYVDSLSGWNFVSVVHVLEHVKDPETFLLDVAKVTEKHLYVEVPDAVEFTYLPKDHDEFNSCHLFFFDVPTLYRMVEYAGFKVTEIKRVYHEKRNLSRIMLLADVKR